MSKILLITPPLTQLNTPYPATCVLTAFLRQQGHRAQQADLSIELIDRLFTRSALQQILPTGCMDLRYVDVVKTFLQGKDLSLQNRLSDPFLWEGILHDMPGSEDLEYDYGDSGTYNRAQLFCTLYFAQISKQIQRFVSPHFELIRYGEKLCTSLAEFDPLYRELQQPCNPIDRLMLDILQEHLTDTPDEVWLSIPFPGNLYAGLRIAQYLKQHYPTLLVRMGGGYVSTELRQMTDRRIYELVDELQMDDGEGDTPFRDRPAPTYDGIRMDLYMDMADTGNPMQRLWSNGRWLKLQMAHGCYWHRCSFCDTHLPYIGHYEAAPASAIADRMDSLHDETGLSGFHFVDEAMPPAVIGKLCDELIRRQRFYTWWGNIRFENIYTRDLCHRMKQAGCIAVSGGIEVASERVLQLINKGVSVKSVHETLRHFRDEGIMVHAYLMYGFPSETEAELFESLATVRDFFAEGLIQSAFWHRYAMTCHSPSGRDPKCVHARWAETEQGPNGIQPRMNPFANNEIPFIDPTAPDWSRYTRGLNTATYNFMRGTGFDVPIRKWFKKHV